MANFEAGSFVTHAKLPELGSGEVISLDKGMMRIRFASGERSFANELAAKHLTITQEAPAKPAPKRASKGSKKSAKAG